MRGICVVFAVAASAVFFNSPIYADAFLQTNLVSDIPGMAQVTDPNVKDAWGMAFSATSPIWVDNRASGVATVYRGDGTPVPLVVAVPPGAPAGPTGLVFAGGTSFNVTTNGSPAIFVFETLGGGIASWNGSAGNTAMVEVPASDDVYDGLALANNMLFATNFKADGGIDVYNSSYTEMMMAGKFTDPNIPAGYAPFNIQNINGKLYVTYAKVTSGVPVPLPGGGGYVDVFDANGNLLQRLVSNGMLDGPWGLTIAPSSWGSFAGALLVGNFGNGEINAYDPTNGNWLGTLSASSGSPISNSGLWALGFGNGSNGASTNSLYFTAGINGGNDGLFGHIDPVPEPATWLLLAIGLAGLVFRARRSGLRY